MFRTLIAAAALLLAAAPQAALAQATAGDSLRLERAIQTALSDGFSGSVVVARGDKVILHGGYGKIKDVRMRPDTRYWISSTGKQFASAGMMLLAERGRLSIDDRIGRWLPGVPADKQAITIRNLLTHTSGLPQGYVGEQAKSNDEAVAAILALPLQQPPGTKFIYANDNYQLAAAIIERASGLVYREFERRELFRPLGLVNIGISTGNAGVAPTRSPLPPRLTREQWGSGGHYASASDLFRWTRALFAGRIISRERVDTLTEAAVRTGEGSAGMAWFAGTSKRGSRTIYTRGNDDFGPNSLIYRYPERDITIVVLTHAGQKTDDLSWSRALLSDLESALQL